MERRKMARLREEIGNSRRVSKDVFDIVMCYPPPLPHIHTQLSEASSPGAGTRSYSCIERRQHSPYKQVL